MSEPDLEGTTSMGTLVAKARPIKLFAQLADHTYVQCDTGGARWG